MMTMEAKKVKKPDFNDPNYIRDLVARGKTYYQDVDYYPESNNPKK